MVHHGFIKTAFKTLRSPKKDRYNVVRTSVKNLRREYSNISLTNALEVNAPRGQIWKLINIREKYDYVRVFTEIVQFSLKGIVAFVKQIFMPDLSLLLRILQFFIFCNLIFHNI